MSLLDDLRNLLARHLAHVGTLANQGTVALIEDHLNRLDAVATNDIAAAEAKVHQVLGELYSALNAPAAPVPAAPSVPVALDVPAEPVAAAPTVPVVVGEPGPELPVAANPTSMAPAAAATPVPIAEPKPAAAEPAEPADAPQA